MLKALTILLFILTAQYSWADEKLEIPDIGNSADAVLSLKEEQKVGAQFMRQLRANANIISDPEVENYIQSLGERLVSYLEMPEFDYTFFVINSTQINAFAVPGGYIGINAGLITAASDESELASVMAHEIAHVSQRHISRSIEKSTVANLATIVALIAAIALAGEGGDASLAALSVGLATSQQTQINYTRTHEKEADRIGIQLLAGAHYDPLGMARFFEKLHQNSRYYKHATPEILMTHPVTLNRLAEAKNLAANYPASSNINQDSFNIFRAKVHTLSTQNLLKLAETIDTLYENRPDTTLAYQLALLENINGQPQQAEQRLNKLIQQMGEHPWYSIALADSLHLQNKDPSNVYQQALLIYPGNKGLIHKYADFLVQQKTPQIAVELLEEFIRNNHLITPITYQLLAQAENKLGHKAASFSALTEFFFLNGQNMVAIQHLENAIQATESDSYQRPALEQRLAEIKAIVLEEENQH